MPILWTAAEEVNQVLGAGGWLQGAMNAVTDSENQLVGLAVSWGLTIVNGIAYYFGDGAPMPVFMGDPGPTCTALRGTPTGGYTGGDDNPDDYALDLNYDTLYLDDGSGSGGPPAP